MIPSIQFQGKLFLEAGEFIQVQGESTSSLEVVMSVFGANIMSSFLNGTDPGLRQTRTPTRQILTNGAGFTANSSTTITLTNDPGTEDHVVISFDGIVQHHSTYTVSGNTVTFNAVIPAGVAEIEASFVVTVSSITVPDGSVSTSKIVDANITELQNLDARQLCCSLSLSKMASGVDGSIISFDSSTNPVCDCPR